jgi:hypothetical protein
MHTRIVGSAFLLSDAISTEKLLSFQVTIASGSDKYVLFSRLCKHYFRSSAKCFIAEAFE